MPSFAHQHHARVAANAMRSRFEILLFDGRRDESRLRVIGESALQEVARVERLLSMYDEESDLFHANARAAREPVRVQAITLTFLRRAAQISQRTDNGFDLSVAPLVQLWRDCAQNQNRMPTPAEIADACGFVGMGDGTRVILCEVEQTIRFDRVGVRLDPGAMGKGYALDRAAEILRDCGIESALLHGGTSSVCAIGAPPDDARGWRVALQHPTRADEILAETLLRDASLGVSAVHGRTYHAKNNDMRFGHVIDPRTGTPVENTLLAAVVSDNAADADALSTALLVLGRRDSLSLFASRFPDCVILVVEQQPGDTELTIDKTDSALAQWRQNIADPTKDFDQHEHRTAPPQS